MAICDPPVNKSAVTTSASLFIYYYLSLTFTRQNNQLAAIINILMRRERSILEERLAKHESKHSKTIGVRTIFFSYL